MKIKQLKLHPIAVADGPLRSSYGLHAPYALRTIVEVVTTDGITVHGSSIVRVMAVQRVSRKGLKSLASIIIPLANAEGLVAHAESVEVRL